MGNEYKFEISCLFDSIIKNLDPCLREKVMEVKSNSRRGEFMKSGKDICGSCGTHKDIMIYQQNIEEENRNLKYLLRESREIMNSYLNNSGQDSSYQALVKEFLQKDCPVRQQKDGTAAAS